MQSCSKFDNLDCKTFSRFEGANIVRVPPLFLGIVKLVYRFSGFRTYKTWVRVEALSPIRVASSYLVVIF